MTSPVRILHLEDNPSDAELVRAMLEEDGLACEIVRVETRAAFDSALDGGGFVLIISDFTLPSYDGRSALALAKTKCPDIPFLFFSGTIGEEAAVAAFKHGATDYILKQRPARLAGEVRRALREAGERSARIRAEKALRKSEDLYRLLLDASGEGICGIDLEGRCTFINKAATQVLGYRLEEMLGKVMHGIVHHHRSDGSPYPLEECPIFRTVRTGQGCRVNDEVMWHRNGTSFHVEYVSHPIIDGGEIKGAVAIFTDITERRKLEEQFRQAQKMEAIGQLTGGIAHDFNNLLTVINGYSELALQTRTATEPVGNCLEQIKEAGMRAAGLTRQLLAFSRRQVLVPKVLDLNAVVTNIDKLLQRVIGEDITLAPLLKAGLGRVKADPGQIEQVIMNLAVNARDAMPHGGKLTIETANVELDETFAGRHAGMQPGPYVMLAVSDTGCGMDADVQKRIFEPFFTTKEQGKGTGLGLATAYGIVKQSGGSIWVYSEVGTGTTFKVYLPSADAQTDAVLPGAACEMPLRGDETVLLVEDDEPLRKLTSEILRKNGYGVLVASNREEALRICNRHDGAIHLMLTDVIMPGLTARQLAEQLIGIRPDMKVLHMSGYTDETIVRHGVLNSDMAYLQKPFTPDALLRKMREVLGQTSRE